MAAAHPSDESLEQVYAEVDVGVKRHVNTGYIPAHGELKKIMYTHDRLIDMMIAHPEADRRQLAAAFGYRPETISLLQNSDAFRERYTVRKSELVDPVIAASLEQHLRAVTMRSLEVLHEKLHQPISAVDPEVALKAAALGLKGLNVGGHGNASPPPAPPATDSLDRLADRLTSLMGGRAPKQEIIDVDATEVPRRPDASDSSQPGASALPAGPRP